MISALACHLWAILHSSHVELATWRTSDCHAHDICLHNLYVINISSAENTFSLYLTNADATLTFKAETEWMFADPIFLPWTMEDISQSYLSFGWELMRCGQLWQLPLSGLVIKLICNQPHSLLLLCMEATCENNGIIRRKKPGSTLGGKLSGESPDLHQTVMNFTVLSHWDLGIACYSS